MQATVSNASTTALADRNAIRSAAAEIAAGCEEFDQFFSGLFDELDALSADFTQRYDAWLEERRSAGDPSDALREQLRQSERQQAAWQRDRASLEKELDMVRAQAAELSEALAEQKRQMEIQRAEWTQELRQMRRLLEMMAQRQLDQQENEQSRPALQPAAAQPAAPASADDPVLDSVMAQFEMLQKDISRRRRHA